mgnify:CR=1 FL=1
MSHPLLERQLKKGTIKPVYLFYGEEEFLMRRALARLEAWLLQSNSLGGKVILEAINVSLADTLNAARSPLLWGGQQLVVLWGVERYKAKDLTPLSKYLEAPSAWTCLVLVAVGLKAKDVETSKLWRSLLEQQAALAFPRLREREVLKWLEEEAKKQGKSLGPGVARILLEMVGANLADLDQQLEKLVLYTGSTPGISAEAARTLASHSRVHSIFELVESLGQSRPEKALTVLHRLLELGEPPSVVVVMLARQIRLLWRTCEALQQGLDADHLAKELGVLPFVAQKLHAQAANFSPRRLQEQLLALQEADLQIKTGMAAPHLLLEKVILDLCPLAGLRSGPTWH